MNNLDDNEGSYFMDIRHLKYFLMVARQKSFTRASEKLHVSQSAISKMIKDLEGEIGTILIDRSSRLICLTDTGAAFLEHAQRVVSLFDKLIPEVERSVKLERGKIVIGLPPITGSTRFAQLLGNFKKKYPDIEIELFEFGTKAIERKVEDGSIDVGIICSLHNSSVHNAITLADDKIQVIASPDNPLSASTNITLDVLQNEKFVMYHPDFSLHQKIVRECIAVGFQPEVIFETSQRELMTQIVASNIGIALLPSKTCDELDSRLITTIALSSPVLKHHMSIIWKKKRHLSRAAHLWLTFAKEYLGK